MTRELVLAATLLAVFAAFCYADVPACASLENDLEYLKGKWRADVTDEGTGLGTDGVLAGWREIVASRGDEPWETTKAKLFAFGCDRTAIGVSPHDWFPAFAPWSFHRGHPLWKILPARAKEVDGIHSPGLEMKIAAGEKIGRWVVWKDYSHCAPDWDYVIALGFPGMRKRLLENWKDAPYYHSRRIAADATLRLVGRLAEHARRANEASPSPRLAAEAAALAHLCERGPRTAYEVLLFIYLEWVMGENFDGFQVRTLSNLDRILTPYYRADIAAGRTTEAEFRDQLRHFWWQWGSIDNYFGQPVYFGGTKADGTTEYNEVSRILLEEHDQLGLPTPKVHIKTGPSTPDWVWRKTLDLARRQRSVTFCGEEPIARAIMGLGYTAEQARACAIWGCYEWGIRDSCNDTIPSYISALKPIELMLVRGTGNGEHIPRAKRVAEGDALAGVGTGNWESFDSFKAAYLKMLEDATREARELAFETEKWTHEINPSMLFSLSVEYSVKTGRDAYHDGTAHGNNSHLLLVGLGSAVDSLLAVEDIVFKERALTLSELGAAMAANWKGHEELRLRVLRSKRKWGNNDPEANALGCAIARCFARQANNIPNSRGGRFVAGGHSSRRFIDFGKLTGATPDGRLAGEEMSKNLSPAPGADTEGATALINTVTAIDPADMPMDLPLDVMLHPSAVAGEKGLDVMRALVEQYHARGFTLIQFNVFNADTLRDAQAHPGKYESLQVRVCGWNVRWNDLPREQQDAYIRRAENIMEGW